MRGILFAYICLFSIMLPLSFMTIGSWWTDDTAVELVENYTEEGEDDADLELNLFTILPESNNDLYLVSVDKGERSIFYSDPYNSAYTNNVNTPPPELIY